MYSFMLKFKVIKQKKCPDFRDTFLNIKRKNYFFSSIFLAAQHDFFSPIAQAFFSLTEHDFSVLALEIGRAHV